MVCDGCPCFYDNYACTLEVYEGSCWDMTDVQREALACPHTQALRAVVEHRDMVLVAMMPRNDT
jgi:hypothetical protein